MIKIVMVTWFIQKKSNNTKLGLMISFNNFII